jgi:glyoxylase-like metal-dependent hydrolase (beta-lactamase superfamily II)
MRTARMLAMPHFFQRPRGPLSTVRGLGLFTSRSKYTPVPIPAYLVEHPSAGPVLIDTGLPRAVADEGEGALGRAFAMAYTIEMEPQWAAVEQIRARRIDPMDVGVVVMTHLHYDHAGAVADFPRATFVVDAAEWRAARSGGFTKGYSHKLIDHPFAWREIDFDDPRVESFASFGRTVDLFGDGTVRLLSTPGHTPGHMSVLLRLESRRELLLTADAAYARRTIDEELVPVFVDDVHRYRRSLREIRRYVEQTQGAEVLCGHDPERWPEIQDTYQ